VTPRFGHQAAIPPRVVTNVPRVDGIWFERFRDCSSCDVSDVVGPLYTMSPDIVALYRPIDRVVGQALTVKPWPGDNLAIHGALSMVEPDDVLVVDWRGNVGSCGAGSRVLEIPKRGGLRGVVIDGAWRDVDDLRELQMPVFARARSPFSPPKERPGEINVPVSCGGVIVEPGDLVVADAEGVAVVPRRYLEPVWAAVNAEASAMATDPEDRARGRRQHFDRLFEETGGVTHDWSGSD
jgi:4-hydroxy-4-methyl-2-oxoglutarate aldolase